MKAIVIIVALLAAMAYSEDICCKSCPDKTTKTYSIIDKTSAGHALCGESCAPDNRYYWLKIFEPKM